MHFDTLIANGVVVTASKTFRADVGIADGKIAAIETDLPPSSAMRVLDATGKYVLPGGIDVHTHLDMPLGDISSSDDFETGTRAAAFGGTTTIIDFATQSRGQSLRSGVDLWMQKAAPRSAIDYGFHCIISDLRSGWMEEMDELVREGISSFKVFMAYPNTLMLSDADIFKVLRASVRNGALVCVHAENGSVIDVLVQQAIAEGKTAPKYHALTRPTLAEAEAVGRAIAIAQMAGSALYVVHVSCNDALQKIREAHSHRLPVYAETCPQYLYLSLDDIDKPGFEGAKYVFTPPVREKGNQDLLWNGLSDGTLDVVSTDHCPFFFKGQKELGISNFTKIPNGGPGIEHRMSLIYSGGVASGRISVNRFVEITATMPAKLLGLYPRKGTIEIGSDADLVIFNPTRTATISSATHRMRVDYSLYEGMSVTGVPETVLSRGRILVENNEFHGVPGSGEFLKRATFHEGSRAIGTCTTNSGA